MKCFPFLSAALLLLFSCNMENKKDATASIDQVRAMEHDEMVRQGAYLVTAGGCNDCHSPKKFDQNGMHIDSSMLLSGSPASMPLPPFSSSALKPGNWIQMSPDITAFVGPWGISFAANLTPDSATGIGAWSKEQFMAAMKTGKHMGMEGGRPIMPPMPWENMRMMKDQDLESIYVYLKSIPAIPNRVRDIIIPDDAVRMASMNN